ncbi:MAG: BamA/TamA family outer membrane protein [Bacteroidetes bacterium]|nr:BamA/TamA family outer membrane protein [Bacteroidota bacterium]
MKKFVLKIGILLFLFSLFATSCKTTKKLSNDEFLVKKNIIKSDNSEINTDDIKSFIKQKPNKKLLGIVRFHLAVYYFADKFKDRRPIKEKKSAARLAKKKLKQGDKFDEEKQLKKEEKRVNRSVREWLKSTIGEAPVILDTNLTNSTLIQLKLYLKSRGFFQGEISKEIVYKKRKAEITYKIKSGPSYKIRNVNYLIEDSQLSSYVMQDSANCLIKPNDNYNEDVLVKERERITKNIKDLGYYYFSKEFIYFKIDSTMGKNRLDVFLGIKNLVVNKKTDKDTILKKDHSRYLIRRIIVYPDFTVSQNDTTKNDTNIIYIQQRSKKSKLIEYVFLQKGSDYRVKPRTITQCVFVKPGIYYKLEDVNQTYQRLSDLKIYKYINVTFNDISYDSIKNPQHAKELECIIQLSRTPIQSAEWALEGTNSSGNLGVAGNIVYLNKNVFKGAEIFNLKLKGALEVQKVFGDAKPTDNIDQIIPFNTMEIGAEAGIDIPKFLIPIKQERFPKYFKPKTSTRVGYYYQKRPDYTRYITNVTFGYDWKENAFKRHILNPIDLNSVKIYPDSAFLARLENVNPNLKRSYEDHLTPAFSYSFIYNNQLVGKSKNFVYFRFNYEMAGNLMRLYNFLSDSLNLKDTTYQIFKIKYAQYIRGDIDFRYYSILSPQNNIAFRFAMGAGYSYLNSSELPFEKSFFVGGANGLRGWLMRSLGPGGYYDSTGTSFDKAGDLYLETNLEYRFNIYKSFKGAAFVDAGNIWLSKPNSRFPEGDFQIKKFPGQIALDAGLGARFDFSFFIIRLDAALQIRDPKMPEPNRWVIKNATTKKINFNFGIGYPF